MAWLRFQLAADRIAGRLRVTREEAGKLLRAEGVQGRIMIRCCTRGGTRPPEMLGSSPGLVRVGARTAVPILEAVLLSYDPDDMPGRGYLEFFEPDVEHVIAMRVQQPEPTAPQVSKPGAKPSPTGRANTKKIRETVTRYREQLGEGRPSIAGLLQFAHDVCGLVGHRDELIAEYHQQFPDRKVGRPRKKSAK